MHKFLAVYTFQNPTLIGEHGFTHFLTWHKQTQALATSTSTRGNLLIMLNLDFSPLPSASELNLAD